MSHGSCFLGVRGVAFYITKTSIDLKNRIIFSRLVF